MTKNLLGRAIAICCTLLGFDVHASTVTVSGTLTPGGGTNSCTYTQMSEGLSGNWSVTCGSGTKVVTFSPALTGATCSSYSSLAEDVSGNWTVNGCVSSGAPLPTIYYIHADNLGSPRMITRPSDNAVMWHWDMTLPFGENAAVGTEWAYNLRFPGQYYDGDTGTLYNYFRDYDPTIGRYIQSDPVGLGGGLNTYAFVRGSPLSKSDPLGLLDNGSGGGGGGGGDSQSPDDPCELIQQVGPVGFNFLPGMPAPLVKMLCVYKCWTLCSSYKVAAFQWIWNFPYNCERKLTRREIHD